VSVDERDMHLRVRVDGDGQLVIECITDELCHVCLRIDVFVVKPRKVLARSLEKVRSDLEPAAMLESDRGCAVVHGARFAAVPVNAGAERTANGQSELLGSDGRVGAHSGVVFEL